MPDSGPVRFEPRIPMWVSAFGPKAMRLAALTAWIVTSVPPQPAAVQYARQRLEQAADEVGRHIDRESFPITALTTAPFSRRMNQLQWRVRRQTGARRGASLHCSYEQVQQFGRRPPSTCQTFGATTSLNWHTTGAPPSPHSPWPQLLGRSRRGKVCDPELIDRTCSLAPSRTSEQSRRTRRCRS